MITLYGGIPYIMVDIICFSSFLYTLYLHVWHGFSFLLVFFLCFWTICLICLIFLFTLRIFCTNFCYGWRTCSNVSVVDIDDVICRSCFRMIGWCSSVRISCCILFRCCFIICLIIVTISSVTLFFCVVKWWNAGLFRGHCLLSV